MSYYIIYSPNMSSFLGEGEDKHLGNNIPLRQSEQGKQQLQLQQQKEEKLSPFAKRILIVDDDLDITFTFKKAFEEANRISGNKVSFHVNTYNNPLVALSEFKPNFYDLILIDINMPKMNGFDFCAKIFEVDINPRVCFMSSGLINQEALREQYPALSIGCFIRKPVTIEDLVRRVKAELE
jgi:DNA-binding response OmpR family regulator